MRIYRVRRVVCAFPRFAIVGFGIQAIVNPRCGATFLEGHWCIRSRPCPFANIMYRAIEDEGNAKEKTD